jgi:hypothetical protein
MLTQEFNPLPPRDFMIQILDPISSIYVFLWDLKDEDNRLTLSWKELSKYHNKNSFRSNLRKLNNKGLLQYQENDAHICIELVGWDDIEN